MLYYPRERPGSWPLNTSQITIAYANSKDKEMFLLQGITFFFFILVLIDALLLASYLHRELLTEKICIFSERIRIGDIIKIQLLLVNINRFNKGPGS